MICENFNSFPRRRFHLNFKDVSLKMEYSKCNNRGEFSLTALRFRIFQEKANLRMEEKIMSNKRDRGEILNRISQRENHIFMKKKEKNTDAICKD